ncbi:MAG: glycosyl hydrolase family 18 protein [Bacteroidota bacterium]
MTLQTKVKKIYNTKKLVILALILFSYLHSNAQIEKSIHQEQNEAFKNHSFSTEKEWNEFNNFTEKIRKNNKEAQNTQLSKIVYGWNPYWMGTAYKSFDYSLLSDVSYFSYEVDPNTGLPSDLHYWLTTELVDYAHNNNCRISLTVTLFSGHETFFANSTSQQTLIDTVIELIKYRNADGVNLDIEAVPSSQSTQLTAFVNNFCDQFHNALPNAQMSIDLPAVNWSDKFDVGSMVGHIDLFLIMGYDYHWSGSDEAGPVAPKNNGELWSAYDATRSINYYLGQGIPPGNLALAVPYYGRDWSTNSSSVPSSTTGSSESKTYEKVKDEYSSYDRHWDTHSSGPYYSYQSGGVWHQCWYDDEYSLADKYDLVKMKDLAGIGIWALGYDGSYPALWDMLAEKFKIDGAKLGEGVFTDMGGPRGNYYNYDDYTFTIAPYGATEIKIIFDEFSTQEGHDTLYIYDGENTDGDLLASLSGTPIISDTLTASSGMMSFRFVSDNSVVSSGWYARWASDQYVLRIAEEHFNLQTFSIYPNPVQNVMYAEISALKNEVLSVTVIDVNGANLNQESVQIKSGNNKLNLSTLISNLKPGNYFLSISSGNYRVTKKILKL